MPMYWTFNCFLGCIYIVYYNVYIVFLVLYWLSNLEFRRRKKSRSSWANWGERGGGNLDKIQKSSSFFSQDTFPNDFQNINKSCDLNFFLSEHVFAPGEGQSTRLPEVACVMWFLSNIYNFRMRGMAWSSLAKRLSITSFFYIRSGFLSSSGRFLYITLNMRVGWCPVHSFPLKLVTN